MLFVQLLRIPEGPQQTLGHAGIVPITAQLRENHFLKCNVLLSLNNDLFSLCQVELRQRPVHGAEHIGFGRDATLKINAGGA